MKQEFIECVTTGLPHLEHSHIGAVWGGGQVAAAGHRVVRRLNVQLASQDAFVV